MVSGTATTKIDLNSLDHLQILGCVGRCMHQSAGARLEDIGPVLAPSAA